MRGSRHGRDPGGWCVWLTGLSSSGKSATATALAPELRACGWPVVILDGDALQGLLWPELIGHSARLDRHEKARRLASLAALLVRADIVVVAAIIAPYAADRHLARAQVERVGRFVEVWVDTPVDVCAARDTRDFYRRARCGELPHFTGISEAYEATTPELIIGRHGETVPAHVTAILAYLQEQRLCPKRLPRPSRHA